MTTTTTRPERPCLRCGTRTRSYSGACRRCQTGNRAVAAFASSHKDALRGGYWTTGVVRRWVPDA